MKAAMPELDDTNTDQVDRVRRGWRARGDGDRLKIESHVQGILAIGVVALFDAVHLEAERIAVQTDGSAVGLPDVQRHKFGAKDISHGLL